MRKTIIHKMEGEDRDKGKTFVITEMAARPAHRWASKAIFALLNAGVEIPEELRDAGLAGIALMGISAISKIPYAVAEPLLDEILECVQIKQELVTRAIVDEDIEEPKTLFTLQRLVLTMHIEPFISGGVQTSASNQTPPEKTA